MNKESKKNIDIALKILNNVNQKNWCCLIDGCSNSAINSHLLQKNGILNSIVKDGHLIEIKSSYSFDPNKKKNTTFKSIGINQALSSKLFCNYHDTSIFKEIETQTIDFNNYKVQLLFSYRAICNELRKKEIITEWHQRMINSTTLIFDSSRLKSAMRFSRMGIADLNTYKKYIEQELNLEKFDTPQFTFTTFKLPKLRVCTSAVFSATTNVLDKFNPDIPLKQIVLNLIPYKDNLYLIIGYHNKLVDGWILDYVSSWDKDDMLSLQKNLTYLFATKIETWSMSPDLFNRLIKSRKDEFIAHWNEHGHDHSPNQKIDFNLFEGIN